MRVPTAFFVAFFVILGGWAAIESSPTARSRAGEFWDATVGLFNGGEPPASARPNWGDVAAKVGEFAQEERDLRRVIAPQQPAPAPAAAAGEVVPPQPAAP